jgi:hypothetical protein
MRHLSSTLLFVATTSAFLLRTNHYDLRSYGFARLNYGTELVDGGFYMSGSYLSIDLNDSGRASSTSDLGSLLLKRIDQGVWLMTFTLTSSPAVGSDNCSSGPLGIGFADAKS